MASIQHEKRGAFGIYDRIEIAEEEHSICDCQFSPRLEHALIRAGFWSVERLLQTDWNQIKKLRNIGKKSTDELEDYLKRHRFSLKK